MKRTGAPAFYLRKSEDGGLRTRQKGKVLEKIKGKSRERKDKGQLRLRGKAVRSSQNRSVKD